MQTKKQKRQKKELAKEFQDHFVATCDIHYNQQCPSCKKHKLPTVVYRYKDMFWKKTLVEICSCESCLTEYIGKVESLESNPEKENLLSILKEMLSRFKK